MNGKMKGKKMEGKSNREGRIRWEEERDIQHNPATVQTRNCCNGEEEKRNVVVTVVKVESNEIEERVARGQRVDVRSEKREGGRMNRLERVRPAR